MLLPLMLPALEDPNSRAHVSFSGQAWADVASMPIPSWNGLLVGWNLLACRAIAGLHASSGPTLTFSASVKPFVEQDLQCWAKARGGRRPTR